MAASSARRKNTLKLVSPEQQQAEQVFGNALQNMPTKYLQCRDLKHLWKVIRDYHVVDAGRDEDVLPRMGNDVYIQRLLACTRCNMRRSDAYTVRHRAGWQSLERLNSTYDAPDDYMVKGIGTIAGRLDMVRGESYRRIIDKIK